MKQKTTRNPRQYKEMIPFAYNFLLDEYGIDTCPNIVISQYLNDCLAKLEPYKDEAGNPSVRIVVSTRVVDNYTMEEKMNIIKHELVHFALAYKGKNYKDGEDDFENELQRLGLPSGGELELRGKVHIYSCNYQHDEIELHRTVKRTNVEDRICPKCKHPMKWKGTFMVTKDGREKIAD